MGTKVRSIEAKLRAARRASAASGMIVLPSLKRRGCWDGKWKGGRIWVDEAGVKHYVIRRQVNGYRWEVSTRCTTLDAALVQLARFEAAPEAYSPAPPRDELLRLDDATQEAFLAWSEERGDVKETLARKRRYLKWWQGVLGGRDLRSFTPAEYVRALEGQRSKPLRAATLRAVYGWLKRVRHTMKPSEDPLATIPIERSRPAQLTRSKVVSQEQFRKTLQAIAPRWRPLLQLLWDTGLHLSEMRRFIESGSVYELPPGKRADGATHVLDIGKHKNGQHHRIAVPASVARVAQEVKARGVFGRERFHSIVVEAAEKAGVPRWSPSFLRHTIATRAIEAGAPVESVSAMLGHRARETVLRFYATHGVVPRPRGI